MEIRHIQESDDRLKISRIYEEIIGTSSCCRSRSPEFSDFGEIISIYLLPQHIGRGYGRQFLDAAVRELTELGFQDIFL